jgi:hypothetical protein
VPNIQEQRQRQRVRMGMPVRVRQIGPPQDILEVTRTLDVCRNGMRIQTRHHYQMYGTVWVTFPYHSGALSYSPEFPASIVRIVPLPSGRSQVAVRFHSQHSDPWRPEERMMDSQVYSAT